MNEKKIEYVVWDKGRPVAATPKEAKRITKRMQIIVTVLEEEFGYDNALERYSEIVTAMAKEDFDKYVKFNDRVQELSKKAGC